MECYQNVNNQYKYEDDHIQTILNIRLLEENLTEINNIFTISAIAEEENKLVEFLFEEKVRNQQAASRTLLLPYLIGPHENGHWVGVVIRFENNVVLHVEYLDSLNERITTKLRDDLIKVFGNKTIRLKKDYFIKQIDNFSCGPCMIENLVYAANNYRGKLLNTCEIREKHILLMEEHAPNQIFYERQKLNRSFIRKSRNIEKSKDFTDLVASVTDFNLTETDKKYEFNCFPRCEYKTRFNETSAFQMSDPEFWGTYFRSTSRGGNSDRLSKMESKDYHNDDTNKHGTPAAKMGTFHSPYQHEKYKSIFYSDRRRPNITLNAGSLYDLLLEYKKSICVNVEREFYSVKLVDRKIQVYFSNDYPCIMVKIKSFNDVENETSSLYNIAVAYFVAITNQQAQIHCVPIELVIRSSFGHNIPSVAETSTSFRINIGIVPQVYADVLIKSLIEFNDRFLVPLINSELKFNVPKNEIEDYNREVKKYNKRKTKTREVNLCTTDDSLIGVLLKVGDSRGGKISAQIMRRKNYVDLLADYVSDELRIPSPDFAAPLTKFLRKLTFDKSLKVTMDISAEDYKKTPAQDFTFVEENKKIKEDLGFWRIIKDIALVLEIRENNQLSESAKIGQIRGLYKKLENANVEFVRNRSYCDAQDGQGSDSDCEMHFPTFFSKKFTVATGMRAINLAQFLSLYRLKQLNLNPRLDTTQMYYETGNAVKQVNDIFTMFDLKYNSESSATIRYIDLSHCAVSGPNSINLHNILTVTSEKDIIVFDYTSTKSEKIHAAVELFIRKVQVILLINSGLKNEQIGADMNPYGTLRIVSTSRAIMNELYFVLKELIKQEVLPKELHQIRKAYKSVGAAVSNKAIYKRSYEKSENYSSAFAKSGSSKEDFKAILQYLNDDNYREKIGVFFSQNLHGAVETFHQNNYIDHLNLSDIQNICTFAENSNSSLEINQLSYNDLIQLSNLQIDYEDMDNEFYTLICNYGRRISEVIKWEECKATLLCSDNVKYLIDEKKQDFDDILICYEKDTEITECIVNYEGDDIYANDGFSDIFERLYIKKHKLRFSDFDDSDSDSKNSDPVLDYDSNESFDCAEELLKIEFENRENGCDIFDEDSNEI